VLAAPVKTETKLRKTFNGSLVTLSRNILVSQAMTIPNEIAPIQIGSIDEVG
jgi:hypothetical protein